MVRWEPGAKERLQSAAIALFLDRGYEETTVQDIAREAGLTERTFFRHYADKREVLFGGAGEYQAGFLTAIREAPATASPFDLVRAALLGSAPFFSEERRPWSRQRQRVIDANTALQERESLKRAALADAMTEALHDRGLPGLDARLAAETAAALFSAAFRTWVAEGDERPLAAIELEALDRLAALLPAPTTA